MTTPKILAALFAPLAILGFVSPGQRFALAT